MLQYLPLFSLVPLYLGLLLLELVDLVVEPLDLYVFYLAHFKGLLLIKLLSLLDFLVYQFLVPLLCQVLNDFLISTILPCFLR